MQTSLARYALLFTLALPFAVPCAAQVALKGHSNSVRFVAFLPDGKTLISGAEDASIRLWDTAKGQQLGFWQQVPKFDAAPSTEILAISGDGRFLARSGKAQGSADIWDIAKVALVRTIPAHQWPVYGVALSGDGSILVTFSQDEFKVWDVASGRNLIRAKAPNLYVFRAAAITSDGKMMAVSSSDKNIAIFDVAGKKQIGQLDGGPGQLHSLAFSPDGSLLASGSDGRENPSVKLWTVANLTLLDAVKGSNEYARTLAFSTDGRLLASGGVGVRVWDIAKKDVSHNFSGHRSAVRSVAFSPDGKMLASGSEDWIIGLWKLEKAP